MTHPEIWKALEKSLQPAWNVIGPFVGIGIGAILGRSWDRKKWLSDQRALECRELLNAMAKTVTALFVVGKALGPGFASAEQLEAAENAYNDSIRTFQDRVFIVKEIEELQLREDWVAMVRGYQATSDHKRLQIDYENMKTTIVIIAKSGMRSWFSRKK
jgi:hypothetical protein